MKISVRKRQGESGQNRGPVCGWPGTGCGHSHVEDSSEAGAGANRRHLVRGRQGQGRAFRAQEKV